MRKEVKVYHNKEITDEIFQKLNYISSSRDNYIYDNVSTLQELCENYQKDPNEIYVILGEDWYIIYELNRLYIEIIEWYSIEKVQDKFMQIMEMLQALKRILLLSDGQKIIADMKLNTSYKFYRLYQEKGYLKEIYSFYGAELPTISDEDKIIEKIEPKYRSIDEYLADQSREPQPEYEQYFYCEAFFVTTEKFKKRYMKKVAKRSSN